MKAFAGLLLTGIALQGVALAQEEAGPPALWTLEPASAEAAGMPSQLAAPDAQLQISLNPAAFAAPPGSTLLLPLPDGALAEAQIIAGSPSLAGGRRIFARFTNGVGEMHLQRGLNAVHGGMTYDGVSYRISGPASGPLRIERDYGDRLGEDTLIPNPLQMPPLAYSEGRVQNDPGNGVVDFLFLYDQSMIDRHGWGLADLAFNDVGVLEAAFEFSGVPLGAAIADLEFIDTPPEYGGYDLISDMLSEVGVFEGYADRKAALGVDILSANQVYVQGRDSFCGVAYLLDPVREYRVRPQYNVCHGSMVLAHETGHNLGLNHGIQTDGEGTGGRPELWAQGFRIDSLTRDGGVYTSIMAYGSHQRPYSFSDPNRTCPERGSVCGIPVEADGTGAHASRALSEFATGAGSARTPLDRLSTAVLPTSRFVATGDPATAFMTVINPNSEDGADCAIRHHGPDREAFSFQETDPATNALVGDPDTPFTLPGGGAKTFLVSLTPSADVADVAFAPFASCANIPMNQVYAGLNAVNLGASATPAPDMIALSATLGGDGVVEIPADGRPGAFAVATLNLGAAGDVTARALSLDPVLPATAEICQTDTDGICMAARSDSVTVNVPVDGTPTFAVFVRSDHPTPFAPTRRVQVQFESGGRITGSTSVAVRDLAPLQPPTAADTAVEVIATQSVAGALADLSDGFIRRFQIVDQPTSGTVTLNSETGAFTYTAGALGGSDSFTWRVANPSGWSTPATVDVTVTELPIPTVTGLSVRDDTDGVFLIDLDEVSDGLIDRFILRSDPVAPDFSFNELTGVVTIDLPPAAGDVSFEFSAENASGESPAALVSIGVDAFNICLPESANQYRVLRRLGEVTVNINGAATVDEAETILSELCLVGITRTSDDAAAYGFDRARWSTSGVYLIPQTPESGLQSYVAYYLTPNSDNTGMVWRFADEMCKTPGSNRLTACD